MSIAPVLTLSVASILAIYAWSQLDPARWQRLQRALTVRYARPPASPAGDADHKGAGTPSEEKPGARPSSSDHAGRPIRGIARWTLAGTLLLLLASVILGEFMPVRVQLRSQDTQATLRIDGASHTFTWPAPPRSVTVVANSPYVHDWGIDGSESLTLNNLDTTYLASLNSNPYIAFDRWLRDEGAYNDWRHIQITDATHGHVSTPGLLALHSGVALPAAFTFDGDIYRLEQPVVVQFEGGAGLYQLHIDRGGRSVSVTNNPTAGTATTLAQWYFPTDPWPYLAENINTLARSAVWALILPVLVVLLGALWPRRWNPRRPVMATYLRWIPAVVPVLAIGGSCALTLYIALHEYAGNPHILDAQSYLMQAKSLALARLALPVPPLPDSFPVPYIGTIGHEWVSQYAPGNALTLVPGLITGLVWLVQPLLGLGTLTIVYLLGRRLYDTQVALLAIVLGAISPLRSFMIGTYLSHPAAAFFAVLSYYLLVRGDWGRLRRPTALAGAALGMAFLCRELSAVLIAAPLAACLGLHLWRRATMRGTLAAAGAFIGGGSAVAALYLYYNWSITGNPLLTPRSILNPTDRYGFGPGHGWWPQHTLAAGLVNLDQLLTGLNLQLFGWPYYLSFAVVLLPFVLGRVSRWDVLNGLTALVLIVGTVGYFYHGIIYGPRYLYEAIPVLLLLAARGIQVVGQVVGEQLAALGRARGGGPLAAYVLLGLLTLPTLLFYLPRHLQLYSNFTALPWMRNLQLTRIYNDTPPHSIVTTGDWWIFATIVGALNEPRDLISPTTTRDTIYAVASTPQRYAQLRATFPHRSLYVLTTDGTSVTFLRWSAK